MARPRTKSPPRTIETDDLKEWQRKLLENLPAWLRYRGIKQTDLAEKLGTSDGQISKYLSGGITMKIGLLRQIAAVLNAHPGDLLRPPPSDGMGIQVEQTLRVMEKYSPEQWDAVLKMVETLAPPTAEK